MIILKQEVFAVLEKSSREGLQTALQQAIRLEHATIPPYLYALYSIKPDSNTEIQKLISSVVHEEMLHMALACNILNAIGGAPAIDNPNFIPQYPGPLPGAVESQLIVPLKPFARDLVKEVFMVIEEPQDPHNYPVHALMEEKPTTIGQFYRSIQAQIQQIGPSLFVDPEDQQGLQVTWSPWDDLIKVTSVETAVQAIETIIEQGEGTSTSPETASNKREEAAHYYRFNEIYLGKTLQPNPHVDDHTPVDQRYFYGDPPIPFDEQGVLPLVANPKASQYPDGSPARQACDEFNLAYTDLLRMLHGVFNGQRDKIGDAVSQMVNLKKLANALMQFDAGNEKAGPSFEYNPGKKSASGPSFAKDIRPLFRQKDINSMKWKFNLADYNDVSQNADAIYSRLQSGTMPCDGGWSPDKVQLFKNWIDGGKLP